MSFSFSSSSFSSSSSSDPITPQNPENPENKRKKLPKWIPVSAFIGTSLALAVPLLMIRRQRNVMLRTASSAPPPRRVSVSPSTGSSSASARRSALVLPHASSAPQEPSTSSSADFSRPGTLELLGAISRVDLGTAFMAGKAFAIATGLVAVFGVGLVWGVKSVLGVEDTRSFAQRMRAILWAKFPSLSSRIHRPPETEDERAGLHAVVLPHRYSYSGGGGEAAPDAFAEWTWEDAEKRMDKAYEEGGISLWAQVAMREMEAEAELLRRKRKGDGGSG